MQKQLRPRRKKSRKLKTTSFSEWIKVFNKKHNSHLNTSIGVVNVKTKNYDK
jgi:hypothetical protein